MSGIASTCPGTGLASWAAADGLSRVNFATAPSSSTTTTSTMIFVFLDFFLPGLPARLAGLGRVALGAGPAALAGNLIGDPVGPLGRSSSCRTPGLSAERLLGRGRAQPWPVLLPSAGSWLRAAAGSLDSTTMSTRRLRVIERGSLAGSSGRWSEKPAALSRLAAIGPCATR